MFFALALAAAMHDCGDVDEAHAQSLERDPKTLLTLAHAVQLESADPVDQAAVLHTLARRWRLQRRGWTLEEQARRYVAPLRHGPRTPRQRWIMWQSWAEVPSPVKRLVERFAAGQLADPCPRSIHWAARSVRTSLPVAVCWQRTRNRFYAAR